MRRLQKAMSRWPDGRGAAALIREKHATTDIREWDVIEPIVRSYFPNGLPVPRRRPGMRGQAARQPPRVCPKRALPVGPTWAHRQRDVEDEGAQLGLVAAEVGAAAQ